jgi:hypothetical protein
MIRDAAASPRAQLTAFVANHRPEVVKIGRAALAAIRKQLPGTVEMVYAKSNGLVIGFSTSDRPSDAVLSLGFYSSWVNVYFLQDATELPDPEGLLRGTGNWVRSIRLSSPADVEKPGVRALIVAAATRADPPLNSRARRKITIRQISPKRRPRK